MAINLAEIQQRLTKLKSQSDKQDNLWKPKAGKTQIRIVPYRFQPDMPFIELYFHYDLGGKNYLSPLTNGNPDPIMELAEKLKTSGDKEDFKLARKLEPKLRTYVPVIVRGDLDKDGRIKPNTGDETVKYWGFGKTVYQDILGYMADPDYGDIVDVQSGRDLVVEFKTAEETGKNFPETKIRVKPNVSTLTDDVEKMKEMITTQKNITELYKEWSYDELKTILKNWLEGKEEEPQTEEKSKPEAPASKIDTEKTPVVKSKDELTSEFDNLFNQKT